MKSIFILVSLNIVCCLLVCNIATAFPSIVYYTNNMQYVINQMNNEKEYISREQARQYENNMKNSMNNTYQDNELYIDESSCEYREGSAMGEIDKFNNLLRDAEWDYNVYGIIPDYSEIEEYKYSLDYLQTDLNGCDYHYIARQVKHLTARYAKVLQYN